MSSMEKSQVKKQRIQALVQVPPVNVFGEREEDWICDFESCYHKLSLHGHRSHIPQLNCVCVHPQNSRLGVKA